MCTVVGLPGKAASASSMNLRCMAGCSANQGKSEGAGALQFCTNYCRCTLDMTVRDQLWDAPADKLKSMSSLCTAMSE